MRHSAKRSLSLCLLLAMLLALCMPAALTANAESADSSSLKGKSVLFVGDSICEAICEQGHPDYGMVRGWPARIMDTYGMHGLNVGYSGASVSNCRGANTVIAQLRTQVRAHRTNYDYVIMHGGTNDAWDVAPVGTMTEGFDGPFDETTFAGGLETMFAYAKENFRNATFGYIINFRFYRSDIGVLNAMDEYVDATIAICEKWDIPYVDLYHDDDLSYKKLLISSTQYLPDLIHPNSAGYDILAPIIGEWMETLAGGSQPDDTSSDVPSEDSPAEPEPSSQAPAESSIAESNISEGNISEGDVSADAENASPVVWGIITAAVLVVIAAAATAVILVRKKKTTQK